MATQMVRKQIYIQKRQNILLKRLAQARGLSEAEIIRQAIEREVSSSASLPLSDEQVAWQEMLKFLEQRAEKILPGEPYRWNREEIYAERERRWLRDRDQK
jgi:hypothetical protein